MSMILDKEKVENSTQMEDAILIGKFQNGDDDALNHLITKYKGLVKTKAMKYFLTGGDKEDVFQEGMIGLYKAIRDYRDCKNSASFKSFAELCITRQIITAVKAATRQKHSPLNTYVSLFKPIYQGDSEQALIDVVPEQKQMDPVSILIGMEEFSEIELKLTELLSDLESTVVDLYMGGQTYLEISRELNVQVKTIDNALQRVKKKLDKYLESRLMVE
ncbi:RNA polymerase sporulation sigma factor SigH [Peribacillus sp. NPDC097295]|uniref:RNA polymerase sporulation sigma factor SigH n=1 Tax=Peribacillus sp. NPDC097295 TaxID=3364402 RepID=UPI0037F238A8